MFVTKVVKRDGPFDDRGIRAVSIGYAFGRFADAESGFDSLYYDRRTLVSGSAGGNATWLVDAGGLVVLMPGGAASECHHHREEHHPDRGGAHHSIALCRHAFSYPLPSQLE